MVLDQRSAPETHAIIGAAIEVQGILGTRLLESAYGDALEIELRERGIPFLREVGLDISYKGHVLRTKYRADFLCLDEILLELKASNGLGQHDLAQVWHYLALTGKKVALLLNFGRQPLQVRRFVHGAVEVASADSADSAAGPTGGKETEFA